MRRRLAFVVAFALCGCGGARSTPRDSAETTAAPMPTFAAAGAPTPGATMGRGGTSRPQEPAPLEAQSATVKLIDAGQEPRRKLRYAFKTGRDEWMRFDLKMGVVLSAPNRPPSRADSPMLAIALRLRGDRVSPEGDLSATYAIERTDVGGDPNHPTPAEAQLRAETARLGAIQGHFVVTARGEMKDNTLDIPPATPPFVRETIESVRDGMRSLYAPLPEEEVGKGARWEVTSRQPMPVLVDVKTNVTLTDIDLQRGRIELKTDLSARAGQPVQPPDAPGNVKMTLEALSGKGSGDSAFSFDRLARDGRSNVVIDVRIRAKEERGEATFSTHTEIDSTYKTLAGPPPKVARPGIAK